MNAPRLHCVLVASAVAAALVCGSSSADDWPAFRHDARRTAEQPQASPLSNPKKVKTLHVVWRFPDSSQPDLCAGFRASPVVYKDQVFIGNGNGYFYALNAKTGKEVWRFPADGAQPLKSKFNCRKSSQGIVSSATIARIGHQEAVIFSAPDPSSWPNFGNGHLFALDTGTGALIWRSDVIARLEGCTKNCVDELHENLGHSSPLVLGDKVYVGIGDHCDNPVQKGRVAAVRLADGHLDEIFSYCSTHRDKDALNTCDPGDKTRGGGVWSPPAGWKGSIYITTGNTHSGQTAKPGTNHGLSLLRLDSTTGEVLWKFQPVPWERDNDPDWSAAPTVMMTKSCGLVIISTQKDGWTHAVDAANGKRLWSFPEANLPFRCLDRTSHGDSKYMRSGAAWGDVYVTMTGGEALPISTKSGYRQLHAFNVCAKKSEPLLRWMINLVPDYVDCKVADRGGGKYCLGNPTITHGIIYIGTDHGHLMAIADPDVVKDKGRRCANADVRSKDCEDLGYILVPQPKILADVQLEGSMAYTEPALADGKVYVSTDAGEHGYVYMLEP